MKKGDNHSFFYTNDVFSGLVAVHEAGVAVILAVDLATAAAGPDLQDTEGAGGPDHHTVDAATLGPIPDHGQGPGVEPPPQDPFPGDRALLPFSTADESPGMNIFAMFV